MEGPIGIVDFGQTIQGVVLRFGLEHFRLQNRLRSRRPIQAIFVVFGHLPAAAERLVFEPIRTGKHNTSYYVAGAEDDLVLRISPPDDAGYLFYERRMMAQEPQLQAQLESLDKEVESASFYVDADTPALAAAALQKQVKTAVDGAGGTLTSTQNLPMKEEGNAHRVAILVRMRGDVDALFKVLYDLEAASPVGETEEVADAADESAEEPVEELVEELGHGLTGTG